MKISYIHWYTAEVPSTATQVMISFTTMSVYLQWTVPNFDGNSDILGYNIYQRTVDSQNTLQPVQTSSPSPYTTTTTMFNITSGVLPNTSYEFAVEACNTIGCGSKTVPVTIRTSPAAGE